MCDALRDHWSYPRVSTATQKFWCRGNSWLEEENMKMYTPVKLPNVLKSAVLFEEPSVILASRSVLGSKWLCSNCYSPTGRKKLWHLKHDWNFPAIYNDGEMSLRIKCFVSGKMWLSREGCRYIQGINDKVAGSAQCPTPKEHKRQDFVLDFFVVVFFFFLNCRIVHLLLHLNSGIVWDTQARPQVLHFARCRESPLFFPCTLEIKVASLNPQ